MAIVHGEILGNKNNFIETSVVLVSVIVVFSHKKKDAIKNMLSLLFLH